MAGKIWIESKGGKGTTMVMTLPDVPPNESESQATIAPDREAAFFTREQPESPDYQTPRERRWFSPKFGALIMDPARSQAFRS